MQRNYCAFILVIVFCTMTAKGQLMDKLFAIANPAPGQWNFLSYDIPSGNTELLLSLPLGSISNYFSSTLDIENELFYFSTGSSLYWIDPYELELTLQADFDLPPNAFFNNIQYDQCSRKFFGTLNGAFTSWDPITGIFKTLTPLILLMLR